MRIALVHDYIKNMGSGKSAEVLHEVSDAPIFTQSFAGISGSSSGKI